MQDDFRNMYGRYRRAAGLTQERAAELLDCSVRTLANWETGVNVPPDDKVVLMCDVYQSPTLAIEHLRASTILARTILPAVTQVSLPQAVCTLLSRVQQFAHRHRTDDLLQIAEDGKIDQLERDNFEDIIEELEGIIQAALALRYAQEG